MTAVGAMISQWRTEAGLSQAQLASKVGTAQSAVSRWESGRDEPRLRTLETIAAACGKRLRIVAEDDDVDRAQIRQQLAMTPSERLASVTNISRLVSQARVV